MKTLKKIFNLLVLVSWIGGWSLAALALHVVRTPETVTVIPKERLHYRDTYVDTRQWTVATAAEHPDVVARMIKTGKVDLLANIGAPAEFDRFRAEPAGTNRQATLSPAAHTAPASQPTGKAKNIFE